MQVAAGSLVEEGKLAKSNGTNSCASVFFVLVRARPAIWGSFHKRGDSNVDSNDIPYYGDTPKRTPEFGDFLVTAVNKVALQ